MTHYSGNASRSQSSLADLLEWQYHVLSRSQAHVYGLTNSALQHRLRPGGMWQKILPGVYATTTGTLTPDQRQMAALLYAGPGAILTGAAAVRRHRLDCPGLGEIDILLPAKSRVQSHGYVRIQRTRRMPMNPFSTRAITFAPLVRAVGDAARAMLRADEVRAMVCEAVQKGRDCTLEDLILELKAGPTAGSRLLRAALAELGEGVRSEAEGQLKFLIDRTALPTPMYNARLFLPDHTFLGMVDVWWQRAGVAGEVDSRQYHMSDRDYAATMARHNRIEAAGINLLHFLPKDIRPKWPVIAADIRDAIAAGTKRPPLPIIAVPANVTDIQAYLRTLQVLAPAAAAS